MATNVANPEQGEVDFPVKTANGEVLRNYILKLSIKAGRALQKKLKKPMGEIIVSLDKMDLDTVQEIAFMLLQKHHSDEVKTPDDAGEVLDDCGGVTKFALAFKELMTGQKAEAGEGSGNPPTAQTSITGNSTSTPVASA